MSKVILCHEGEQHELTTDEAPEQGASKLSNLLDCPNCPNQGWFGEMQFVRYGEQGPEYEAAQVQCEFCCCEPKSVFNNTNQAGKSIVAHN